MWGSQLGRAVAGREVAARTVGVAGGRVGAAHSRSPAPMLPAGAAAEGGRAATPSQEAGQLGAGLSPCSQCRGRGR